MYGRGCSAGCEDKFDGHEVTASALSGHAGGWCEDTFDDSVHASENSVVARVAACSGRELDVAVAAARCGESNCNGHLLEFKNTLLVAESGSSLHCLNNLNSLNCHPSCMRVLLPVRCALRVMVWLGMGFFVMVEMVFHVCWAVHVWMGCMM